MTYKLIFSLISLISLFFYIQMDIKKVLYLLLVIIYKVVVFKQKFRKETNYRLIFF